MTLSRKRTASGTVWARRSKSTFFWPSPVTKRERLIEPRVQAPHGAGAGVHQGPVALVLDGLHEGLAGADGDVEVGEGGHVGLEVDELLDVGGADGEDGHVGAATGAPP